MNKLRKFDTTCTSKWCDGKWMKWIHEWNKRIKMDTELKINAAMKMNTSMKLNARMIMKVGMKINVGHQEWKLMQSWWKWRPESKC